MDVDNPTNKNVKISVITATYNAAQCLPKLIESLQQQTDKDFEWVVADGGSTDGTLELLEQVTDITIKFTSQADFGIYDALNRAIKQCDGDYYVVAGADDYFYNNAIADLREAVTSSHADLITATIKQNDQLIKPLNKSPWLYGMRSYVSSHSIGTLFKKSLHNQFGYYSNKLPITADNLFILKVMQNNSTKLKQIPAVIGCFGADGLSGSDIIGTLTENFRTQLMIGSNKYLQLVTLFLRLLKNSFRY
ncbi:glycosyltransferase [Entomomonas asaccharolytica]|uniref:Glycosyltransferase n=1 Tax=Entomomonas asaccharolytica TaxID=2785331 RepID=A0A974ND55_9GAMM|nr:glycosyltransferase [Entomomonas asaccharolytica]QQP84404.1 glycosyltransferase [Entomomonas asaccharolytica]